MGRRLALLDVRMKEGNSKNLRPTGALAPFSRLAVEAPIVRTKSSLLWRPGALTSMMWVARPFVPLEGVAGTKFYDLTPRPITRSIAKQVEGLWVFWVMFLFDAKLGF